MSYLPKPIDIRGIDLADDLEALKEKLAEHVHDLWAQKRIADGWRYGPERNDEKLETPNLVSFASLPEAEKEYDREISFGILKAIIALGYKIENNNG